MYGLSRLTSLREVRPQTNHLHSDRVVLCELALRAPFCLIEDALFIKRHHDDNVYRDWRARMAWFEPELTVTGRIRLPHWHQALDLVAMASRSRLGARDQLLCAAELLMCFWRMRGHLIMDVVDGVRMVMMGAGGRRRRYGDEKSWR